MKRLKKSVAPSKLEINCAEVLLETKNLLLVPISFAFTEEIFREFTPEITRFMSPRSPKKLEETKQFIQSSLEKMKKNQDLQMVILKKATKEFLGCAGLHHLDTCSPELGIWIKKSAHGQGFGREAISALKKWADNNLEYEYLLYPVDQDNLPSRRIPESLGGIIARKYNQKSQSGKTLHLLEYRIYPPKNLADLRKELKEKKDVQKAKVLQKFFKTGKGKYAEGDEFLGVPLGEIRQVVKKYFALPFTDLKKLLESKIHEERMAAVVILTERFKKADLAGKKEIYDFYLENIDGINSWDLVDSSAPEIVGGYLWESKEPRQILYDFAGSDNLWKRRVSIIATYYFIRKKDFSDTLRIAEILLEDKHDLIHKAVGWMLREIGKQDLGVEERFLKRHYKKMPRTALRYAIEKFPQERRLNYLKGKI